MHEHDNNLPSQIDEVVELIGLIDAMLFVAAFGGRTLTFTEEPASGSRGIIQHDELAKVLGPTKAADVERYFAHRVLDVPRCLLGLKRVRDREIRLEVEAGRSRIEVALKYKLTERQLWNILKQRKPTNRNHLADNVYPSSGK